MRQAEPSAAALTDATIAVQLEAVEVPHDAQRQMSDAFNSRTLERAAPYSTATTELAQPLLQGFRERADAPASLPESNCSLSFPAPGENRPACTGTLRQAGRQTAT
jgi:hypothetical protein